jgi:hypothetical protein
MQRFCSFVVQEDRRGSAMDSSIIQPFSGHDGHALLGTHERGQLAQVGSGEQ